MDYTSLWLPNLNMYLWGEKTFIKILESQFILKKIDFMHFDRDWDVVWYQEVKKPYWSKIFFY